MKNAQCLVADCSPRLWNRRDVIHKAEPPSEPEEDYTTVIIPQPRAKCAENFVSMCGFFICEEGTDSCRYRNTSYSSRGKEMNKIIRARF